jgi:hypothetical protein
MTTERSGGHSSKPSPKDTKDVHVAGRDYHQDKSVKHESVGLRNAALTHKKTGKGSHKGK